MRVTNVRTDAGSRLAVARDDGWAVLEGPGIPTSVDDLVRGGEEARQRAEQATPSRPVSDGMSIGLCIPQPGKIICIGLNYRRHAIEAGLTLTATPLIFAKFNNTLVSSGQPVALPTTAPDLSLMVPEIVPPTTCAFNRPAGKLRRSSGSVMRAVTNFA